MDEFLEKVFEAAFKRESEQDENIVRSLPFFVAALGLVLAIFSQVVVRMPPVGTIASAFLYVLFGSATAIFSNILWCLFQLVRARDFKLPPNEERLLEWADSLQKFHKTGKRTRKAAEELAIVDVRRRLVEAYAEAAVDNRKSNRHKFKYRAQGFMGLVLLMVLASASVGVIFFDKTWRISHGQGATAEAAFPPPHREKRIDRTVRDGEAQASGAGSAD
ncbi:hypothetical protein [Brevundimonas sp. GCM10030266]|uniref:hypothetical protein n=1 Tax=Brevundimonas sp. GCM10030266 TaxID=3273386 RepID=UPI0036073445